MKIKSKNNKYQTVGTVLKFNRNIIETESKSPPLTHNVQLLTLISWFGTGTIQCITAHFNILVWYRHYIIYNCSL